MPIDPSLRRTSQTNSNAYAQSTQTTHYRPSARKQPEQTYHYTINTTSGKRYTLDQNRANWIINRWKRDGADSYGYDDDDQMAKRNGQMSAAMRGTYKNSQVDRDLFSMGLPSEKYLERYMEDYDRWHTGDISRVFGNNVPDDDWTGMKRMYQQSFRYENTPEDQARKRQGLVPLSQLDKYTDTELDDDLLSKGLPPMAELGKYAGMYNNYKGVDNLYKNAALAYTRVRATQDVNGKFIQNDNNSYTVMDPTTGQTTTKTGKQWYAKSFYDELGRTNEDGSFVYGDIIPLLRKSRSESEDDDYVDPTKSFIEQMDKQFAAYGKEDDNEDDFLNHQAFSYDDFAKNYESYYTKYIKDLQVNGQGQTIGDLFSVAAMEADADAARAYYDVQPGQEAEFITRFRKDHPEATAGDMFTSILSSGSSIKTARRVMQEARRNTDITGGKNYREDGWGWYDIGDGFTKAKGKVAEAPIAAATPENKNATFNFNDVYTAVSRDYDASAEAAKAEQRSLRKSNRQPSEAEPVDEEFLEKIRDAITVYDSAAKAYEDTAGPGAPSEASREPINKANELLKSLGFKSIHSARRYVDSVAKDEEEDEAKRKAVGDALKAYDSAKADAGLAGDAKSAQAVIDAEKKVTSLLGVNSAEDAREWLRTGELPGELSANGSAVDVDDAIRIAQTYMEQNGGWNKTVATDAFKKLYDMGVSPEVVQQAAAEMNERFGDMEETFTEKEKPDEPSDTELLESMNAAVAAGEKADEEDVEAITAARNAIEGALVDDNGPIYSTVDGVIGVLDSVAARTNPAAMRLALADLGFVGNLGDGQVDYGEFTGTADDLTAGWSEADKTKLRYKLLDYANGWTIRKPTADEKATDSLVDKIGRDLGLDDWMLGDHSAPNKVIEHGKFEKALEWAQQQIDSGALTDWRAYNILASAGYQDEMEQYMPEEWHKAHFKAVVVPQIAGSATGLNALTWEEMTPEQRDAMAEELWAKTSAEEKAARYGDPNWWKYDTSVQRTGAQALDQQMSAILPGLIAQAVSTPVTIADAVFAGISGRPEMWDFSKKLSGIQQDISSYGSVDGSVLNGDVSVGVKAAQWATDAVQELVKMEFLGNIGGMVGEAFKGTAVGGKVLKATASSSKVVKKVADMFLGAVQASPFVVESFAGHYTEAKQRGASNGEAAFYGAVCGLSEGLIEGFNFDKIWGKAIGSEKIAERLMQGGLDYLKMGLNGQAVLSSIALGFLGEATEEFVGYGIETGMKMKYKDTWGKGTQWSWADAGEQALVGGILGALGAGLHSGSMTTRNIIMDYAIDTGNVEAFMKVAPDITMSIGIAEGMSEGDLEMYRKGGAKIMSSTAYSEMLTQMANLDAGIENAGIKLEKDKADLQRELENRLIEIDEKAAKGVGIDLDAKGGASLKEALDAFSKKCNELGVDIHDIDLAKYISGGMTEQERAATEALLSQRSQEAVQRNKDAVRKSYDKAIADAEAKCKTTVEQNMKLYDGLTKQMQEHWVGIYLANYNNIISGMTDEMVSNLAKAYRNGMQYDPEVAAEQAAKRAAQAKAEEAKAAEAEEAEATASSPEGTAAPTSIREAAYNRVYTDQEAGKVYASEAGEAEGATPLERAENARKNFQAKTTTRFRRVTLELAGFEASEGMSAKEIITEAKKTMTPEAAQKLDMYMKLSKALSLNMVVRDVVPGTSGYVQDGKLYVTLSGKQSLLRVVSHELTHYMQTYASDGYSNLRSHLVDEVGGQEAFDQRVAEKAQQYGYDLNTADGKAAADDEVCAELCESMLENKDALERFVNKDMEAAKTLKARLAKTLVAVKSAIRSLGTSDSQAKSELAKEQETVEAWYTTLSDAIDNANAEAKGKTQTATETATVTDTTTEAPQAPPAETNPDLFIGDEDARREQLRSELEELAKRGTKVQGVTRQEVNDVLDRVIMGDKSNYSKADLAQIRGMLAQLIPEVQAMVNGDENVDATALNERLTAALDYMLGRYSEGSEDYYGLRELIPNKIALSETAYKDLRAKDMTLRQASTELMRALGGKFVNFVYKKSPSYNNAMTIDELWQTITDQYGEQNGVGNIGEDALALIDYAKDRSTRTSFDDLYGSQREDVVNAQVGEFLDAVQSLVEGKAAETAALHSIDDDYMPLAEKQKNGTLTEDDARKLSTMVDEAAEAAGYSEVWAHGTPDASFTAFDLSKAKNAKAIFLSDYGTAAQYANTTYRPLQTRLIGKTIDNVDDALAEIRRINDGFNQPKKTEDGWRLPRTRDVLTLNTNGTDADLIDYANKLREKRAGGVYSLYVKEGRKLTVDAKNAWWDRINSEYGRKTDDIARWAQANGYDSVEIDNVHDGGFNDSFAQDVLIVFDPNGVKSTDLVTYDKGNIIPLSERFNPNKTDIRYSIDDDYMPLAERYDAGIATEADTEEMRKDVDKAARENGYSTTKYYHGTPFQFNSFDRGQSKANNDFGPGIYLTNNELNAVGYSGKGGVVNADLLESVGSYAESVADGKYDYKTQHYDWIHEYNRAFEERLDELQEQGRVIPLYAKVSNPFTVSTSDYIPTEEAERIIMKSDASDADKVSFLKAVSALQNENGMIRTSDFANGDFSTYLANVLEKLGYDGIVDKTAAVKHGQPYSTEHLVVFDARNVKESSLITYDDDNNIIPLSERFDPNKTDIRWTVDDDLDDLVQQYGAIEQGREPRARDVQVPRQVDDQTRVSKLIRSGLESATMTDATAEEVKGELVSDIEEIRRRYSYIPKSNDETLRKARDYISRVGISEARRVLHNDSISGNFNLNMEAVGMQLLWDAAERGDQQAVKELYIDLRPYATEAGQRAQLFNMLKEMKGVGSAWYVENLVKDLNTKYADDIATGAIDGPITVSDDAMNQLRAAKTQAEVDAAEGVVATELAAQLPLTWDEKLSNWRYLSMLGNPITHVRNFTGNKLMYGMGGMKDVAAASLQRILENTGITNESDRAHALLTNADWKYWNDFVQKSYEEQRSNLQGGGKLGFQSLLQQNKRSFDNKVLDAIARGKNPGVVSEKGRVAGLFENIKNNGAMGMLEVADAWGLEDNYKRALTEYMKAQGYSLKDGKVGKTGKDGTFTEISPEAMNKAIEWASGQAWTNTFRGPSKLATELNKISKMNPVAKLVVEGVLPFKKTPFNIAKQGFWYSPAGLVTGTVELLTKVKQGKMSAATAIDHMASGLTGTALMALGVVLAKAGILRGGGEDKKKLETYLEDTGDQTYAFKFGNVSINMSAIAPATIPLFMGVALQEMLSRNGEDEGVDLSTITDVLAGTLNPFMEMSFMSSLNSALKNYNNEGIGGALGSTILTAAQNYGSQYLPTLGGKVAQFIDPTQRTTKSSATSPVGGNMDYYWRSLVKKVPGAEATLQPDVNIWGQTTTKDSFGDWALDFANKFILPTNVKVTNRDAVDNELIRVVESTGIADFLPSDGAKYFKVKGDTYKMNASQYTEYSKERGQAAYAAIKELMQSPSYINATDETKAEMLKKALEAAYKTVNNIWKDRLGAFNH